MKVIALTLLLLSITMFSFAQTHYQVKGLATDSMATYSLVNTTITILNQKDSTLVKYTRANEDGSFAVDRLAAGKFILLVTYPGYADYVEEFKLDTAKPVKDFGKLNLILKATLLEGVIIQGKVAAIKIKGDTTEFNAGSYNLQPNAKVEDLLKQLPGIQVDKEGKITAQGQTVTKVLVDGEEFFGDDPTLVTKNLRSDMVDKVQLYDKKSDQADFTGIDDGEKTKTINIKLKEDKKNGYFGKADASLGTDRYYKGQAMFNAFKNKQKIAAYAIFGNTGQTGLDWHDRGKYSGSSGNMEMTDDGGIIMYYDGSGGDLDSFDGRYNGQGIPSARTAGIHYENKWNSDKQAINSNYKLGSIGVKGSTNNLTQNNLPTGLTHNSSDQQYDNQVFRQKMDVTYTVKLDSTSTLKIKADGSLKDSKTNDIFTSATLREDSSRLNTGLRELRNDVYQKAFNASALWTKKLKKKGRTLSVNLRGVLNQSEANGYLNSTNNFFNPANIRDSTTTVNQYKTNHNTSSIINTTVNYTEPLSKKLSLVFNYGLDVNNSSSDRKSFNESAPGNYSVFDPKFSNNYDFDQLSNVGGASLNYRLEKSTINIGTKVAAVNFKQYDVYADKAFKRDFVNWSPQATYRYQFSQQKSLSLSYSGSTTQPGIDQIQPIRENTDPLNISIGNPNLKPSYSNNFNFSYNSYKVLSERYIYLYGSYSFTVNPITNNTVTDATGANTYQSINIFDKNSSNYYLNASTDMKIKKLDMSVGLGGNFNGNVNYGITNDVLNSSKSFTYSVTTNISKYKSSKYDFRISVGPTYNVITSSLQKSDNKGWGFNGSGNLNIYLPGKLQLSTDGNYQLTGKTQTFNQKLERFIWNAALTKKFFKQENLKLSLSGNDLLNQNVGFDRFSGSNMITQNRYTTIQRYFLCGISWDFSKMGISSTKK